MISSSSIVEYSYLGHKGRCFDIRVAPNNLTFISASEDGTAKIWDLGSRKCINTLKHNSKAEVLRAVYVSNNVMCTGGSDGKVAVWTQSEGTQSSKPKLVKVKTLNHRNNESQIYACEALNCGTRLVTAADNQLYLWDLAVNKEGNNTNSTDIGTNCLQSWDFGSSDDISSFGGDRNVHNEVYVFDAKICPSNDSLVSVALSNASIRFLDIRQSSKQSSLGAISLDKEHHPIYSNENFGHATSVAWSGDAKSMLVSLGSGKVAVLDIRMNLIRALLVGHTSACYGAAFLAGDSKCMSWSSDTTVRTWNASVAVGVQNSESVVKVQKDFPLFSCAVRPDTGSVLCGGGSGDSGSSFLGTPIIEIKSIG